MMSFQLWRQDDNGQRFLIKTFSDRSAAEEQMALFSRIPHKQCYWIEPMSTPPLLDLPTLRDVLANHVPRLADPQQFAGHRHAAVALLLRSGASGPEILYLLRATHDDDPWSGDIGFPGGHVDDTDASSRAATEREVREEIGLDLTQGEALGRLDDIAGAHLPIIVSCFPYLVPAKLPLQLNHEVVETFWVPLHQLIDPRRHRTTTVSFRGETLQRPAVDLLGPGRPVLWGITYRLTAQFLGIAGHPLVDTPIP